MPRILEVTDGGAMKKIEYSTIGSILLFVLGFGIMLYPTVSDLVNRKNSSKAIAQYQEELNQIPKENYEEMFHEARKYNEKLKGYFISGVPLSETYQKLLNSSDSGMMGYVEISKLDLNIPIYHGTGSDVLQQAVGHLEGSSLPVGGAGTHTVITGHSGLPSARIFTDLNLLEVGDLFSIVVLGEKLTYQVEQMTVVSPKETDALKIIPGEDHATLITCTPYAVNTHRLLVRGVRVEEQEVQVEQQMESPDYTKYFVLVGIVVIGIIIVWLQKRNKKRRLILLGSISIVMTLILFDQEACAATPVNDSATLEARILLNYLDNISRTYTLSGQHDKPSYPTEVYNRVYEITGSFPAVWSGDFGFMNGPNDTIFNRDALVSNAIEKWNNGSVPMLTWHMVRPDMDEPNEWIPGVHNDFVSEEYPPFTDEQFRDMTTPGTTLYNQFIERIDRVVPYFQEMQKAGVPVLWRPFHEINGNWFWWGGNATYSKELYRVMYDRYVNVWGLDNLIWVWCVDRPIYDTSIDSVYPGDNYVDVLTMDIYDGDYKQSYYDELLRLANGKPIALSEVGDLPTQEILEQQPQWSFFVCWTEYLEGVNTQDEIKQLYWNDRVLTREETNDFLTASPPSINPVNLAADSSSVIEVSSAIEGYGGNYAVDENYQSAWKADEETDQYIMVHLEEEKKLSLIKVYWGNTYPKQYQIQISRDGVNFDTIYTNTDSTGGEQRIMLDSVWAKDIKIYSWEASDMELCEIEIYELSETDVGSLSVLKEGMTAELIVGVVLSEDESYIANSGDELSAYKVIDIKYSKNANNLTYEFTDTFKGFLRENQIWAELDVASYVELLSQENLTGIEGEKSLEQLLGAFSSYCKTHNISDDYSAVVSETGIAHFGQVDMGQYIILGEGRTTGEKVHQTVTANVAPVTSQGVYKLFDRYFVKMKTKKATLTKEIVAGTTLDQNMHTACVEDEIIFQITIPMTEFAYPEGATNKTFYVSDTLGYGMEFVSQADDFIVRGYNDIPTSEAVGIVLPYSVAYTVTFETDDKEQNKGGIAYIDFAYDEILQYQYVTIEYKTKLTEHASVGTRDGNENIAELVYSNTPFEGTTWSPDSGGERPNGITPGYYACSDVENIYTYAIVIDKYDARNYSKKVENAVFAVYQYIDGEELLLREKLTTNNMGQLIICGLEAGTYVLKESKAPDGYEQLRQEIEVILNGTTAVYTKEVRKITEQSIYTYTPIPVDEEGNAREQATDQTGRGLYYTGDDEYSYLTLADTGVPAYIKEVKTASCPETEIAVIRIASLGEENGYYPVAISNIKMIELPATGGAGEIIYYLVGMALVMTSIVLYGLLKYSRQGGA